MNGAEFKTLREACGLSVSDMAKLAISPKTGEPVGERTVRYWESGAFSVPDDVAQLLLELDNKLSEAFNAVFQELQEAIELKRDIPKVLHFVRYRENEDLWYFKPDMKGLPATYHAALLNRIRMALSNIGCETRIIWMDPAAYHKWLGTMIDNESIRAIWASENYK